MTRERMTRLIAEWWLNSNRTKEEYEAEYQKTLGIQYETALTYLDEADVQDILKEDYKRKSAVRMLEIYDNMLKKALDGDVKSAEWIEKFNNSSFFKGDKTEIDKIIESLQTE